MTQGGTEGQNSDWEGQVEHKAQGSPLQAAVGQQDHPRPKRKSEVQQHLTRSIRVTLALSHGRFPFTGLVSPGLILWAPILKLLENCPINFLQDPQMDLAHL